jgi:hypothetical protein
VVLLIVGRNVLKIRLLLQGDGNAELVPLDAENEPLNGVGVLRNEGADYSGHRLSCVGYVF